MHECVHIGTRTKHTCHSDDRRANHAPQATYAQLKGHQETESGFAGKSTMSYY